MKNLIFAIILISLSFDSICQSTSFTDARDGISYSIIKIGNLLWMAEDLKLQTKSSHCPNYSDDQCNDANFYSYQEIEALCPDKWRLPTVDEWNEFVQAFENVKTVRMLEDNKKSYRVDFLDGYNILERNPLNIKPIGRTEGNVWQDGYYADYWTVNPKINDQRFHMHISQFTIAGHAHKHNINERNQAKNRKFAVRCVCEENQ